MVGSEADLRRGAGDGAAHLWVIQLGYLVAVGTDQKLAGVFLAGMGAAGVGVEAFDTVDQAVFEQELQGAVDCRWRTVEPLCAHLFEQCVGADRLMAAPDQLQHPLALFSQTAIALGADARCLRHGGCDAAAVVMRGEAVVGDVGHGTGYADGVELL